MPYAPYPIDGTVYDRDGSTALSGATVVALNITTAERVSITTNASGEFTLDLANLASGYTVGDRIQLTAFYGTGSGARCLSKRHTSVIANFWTAGDMVLHSGLDQIGTCNITFASHSNSHSSGLYVDFYDRKYDVLIFRIEVAAGETETLAFGYLGVKMDGGFIRVFESETSGRSEVVTVYK